MRGAALVFAIATAAGARAVPVEADPAPGPAWKRHTIDDTSRGADGVKLGDIDHDGLPDVVTGWEEGGVVRVYVNPGKARVRERWPKTTVGEVKDVEDAIFADLDRDGALEVVSGTEGKTATMYWHRRIDGRWRTDAFASAAGTQRWLQVAVLDLDGQHGPDLLVASKERGAAVGWLQAPRRTADPTAWTYHRLRDAGWIMSLTPTDLDGDGDEDVLITDRKGPNAGLFWLENPGASANRAHAPWKENAIGAAGREVMFADIGDVNADGRVDVVVAVKPADVLMFLREADGSWTQRALTLDAARLGDAKAVKIADLDGDGLPDLLFSCEHADGEREGLVWLEQRRGGGWKQHRLGGPQGRKFDLMQTVDLDGDGDLDVITCEEEDQLGVVWYENPSR